MNPEFKELNVDLLRFDPLNPRLAVANGKTLSEPEIQSVLEGPLHVALELVESLLENGFIRYEPLVARKQGDLYYVIEGNRRLAAIRHILKNRASYEGQYPRVGELQNVPVLVFDEAAGTNQRVYLGVHHLFGFRQWPAESKARFLDSLIRTDEDLHRALKELNIGRDQVRRFLIPYRLRLKATASWRPYLDKDFWVVGESLNRTGIKEYLELKTGPAMTVTSFNKKNLQNFLGFVFGQPGSDDDEPKIRDTRQLSHLGKVLKSPQATRQLERGASLEDALLYIDSTDESLRALEKLVKSLKIVIGQLGKGKKGAGYASLKDACDRLVQATKVYRKNA